MAGRTLDSHFVRLRPLAQQPFSFSPHAGPTTTTRSSSACPRRPKGFRKSDSLGAPACLVSHSFLAEESVTCCGERFLIGSVPEGWKEVVPLRRDLAPGVEYEIILESGEAYVVDSISRWGTFAPDMCSTSMTTSYQPETFLYERPALRIPIKPLTWARATPGNPLLVTSFPLMTPGDGLDNVARRRRSRSSCPHPSTSQRRPGRMGLRGAPWRENPRAVLVVAFTGDPNA